MKNKEQRNNYFSWVLQHKDNYFKYIANSFYSILRGNVPFFKAVLPKKKKDFKTNIFNTKRIVSKYKQRKIK